MRWRRRTRWLATLVLAVLLVGGPAWARPTPGRASGPPAWAPVRRSDAVPAAVAPVGGRVLRHFDPPATPYGPGHRGVDLAGVRGEPVRSALAGTVTFAGHVAGVMWVTVTHDRGLSTTYGGFASSVRIGDAVALGAPLGTVTERARLDWGARRNRGYVDPLRLLGGWRPVLVPVP
ncbi:MAG TPA: peptidoglycan DD-metalloendopeptidase family protein [Euzebyales bacterium]|nr:peptidoglycan DD-metalloendopeptidase family protein [Euzebyales bacterium]